MGTKSGKEGEKLGGGTWQTRWPQEPVGFKPVRVQIPPAAPILLACPIRRIQPDAIFGIGVNPQIS